MANPRCPYCQAKSPTCIALQRFEQFGLVYCNHCGAIFGVVPIPSISPLKKPKVETPAAVAEHVERPHFETPPTRLASEIRPQIEKKPAGMLEVVGNADLSDRRPYDPVLLANQIRAAGLNRGSRYVHIAIDDGPPLCTQHKIEMARATIPDGYKNSGREVWLCPQFNACGQWELAK